MAIWADMLELFPHTVTVEPFVSEDSGGNRTYGTAVEYEAYIKDEVKYWKWENANELQSHRTIYVNGDVDKKDRVTLPSGFEPQVASIIHVIRRYDESGFHHSELYA